MASIDYKPTIKIKYVLLQKLLKSVKHNQSARTLQETYIVNATISSEEQAALEHIYKLFQYWQLTGKNPFTKEADIKNLPSLFQPL